VLLAGCQLFNQSSAGDGLQGRLAWPKDGDLWVFDLASKQQRKITDLPGGAAVTGAAWSPDGTRIVYAQFSRRANERASGADLIVANADGSSAHLFAERDTANTVLDSPQWGASGRVYYAMRRTVEGRESLSVVAQSESGPPRVLVENGFNPTISRDESTLVYLRNTRVGQTMLRKALNDPGDGCELLSDLVFQYLSQPRISPDGTRVAFGGSGEAVVQPSGCAGASLPKTSGATPMFNLLALLAPGVAEAHALPADVYTVNLDGSNLVRVAKIQDDDPTVAWSPDGSRLAIFGIAALYAVDAKGGAPAKLVDRGGYGGLDWTR